MVEQSVIVAVEESEIFLVLFLFVDGDVFLYFFFGVVVFFVYCSKCGDLFGSWDFGEVVAETDFFSSAFHQLQYNARLGRDIYFEMIFE